jgi:hypothetical protein
MAQRVAFANAAVPDELSMSFASMFVDDLDDDAIRRALGTAHVEALLALKWNPSFVEFVLGSGAVSLIRAPTLVEILGNSRVLSVLLQHNIACLRSLAHLVIAQMVVGDVDRRLVDVLRRMGIGAKVPESFVDIVRMCEGVGPRVADEALALIVGARTLASRVVMAFLLEAGVTVPDADVLRSTVVEMLRGGDAEIACGLVCLSLLRRGG